MAAGHGCFHLCPSALSKEGQVTQQVLQFIGGIKLVRERERERDGGWQHASYMYMYMHIHVCIDVHVCTCKILFFPPFFLYFLFFLLLVLLSLFLFLSFFPLRLFLESESERSVPAAPNSDLRLHYATLISSLINSFPEGSSRARLLPSDMRRDMFFMIAGWAGGFWHQSTDEQDNK